MSQRTDIIKRNNISVLGSGSEVLLFAHGFGCDQRIWEPAIAALQGEYTIVLFDYVGAGKSDKSHFIESRYANIHGYAQDIIEVVEALHLEEFSYVGHSISGAIGYLVSLALPEKVKKVIAFSPSACYLNDPTNDYYGGFEEADIQQLFAMMEHNFYEWAGFLAPKAMNQDDRPELAADLAASFRATDPTILKSFARATFLCDIRERLPEVKVPVVLFYGTADMVVPESAIEFQIEHLEHCKAIQIPVTGHYPHVSEPKLVAMEIEKELNR
ncbi:hypothetical protein CWE08_03365 [Aliidiomarina iranensis]|uniref:AB hydrolase-1 domain-containing protein n=1 Tax=Aliidiomarina iranensis TaxID=1434071 RepID=A0A432VZR2_9GAMM|nr:alpha/beta hydrolase [Aliidiomarina iranensis]RUO22240.1 hypothetical protein CWE08_03365 [Aliidiomarina iranensis]